MSVEAGFDEQSPAKGELVANADEIPPLLYSPASFVVC